MEANEETDKAKSEHAQREERILQYWQENQIFAKTLAKDAPKGQFVFYEGPPTANGKPGIHHMEARVFKDAIPRYKTMQGFYVRRRAGWDTHGLPVEIQVEKELGLKSKKEVEQYGVKEFNKACKESTLRFIGEFERFTKRIGYWTDFDDAYFTFDNSYIESLWNIVAKVNRDDLLYKDYKVVPWCTRCGTTLSSHELAQGYEEVKDLSVYVKFKVVGQENTYLLAWTTTPWTLPGNVALAVGEDIDYVFAKVGDDTLILAESRLKVLPEGFEIIKKVNGKELVGLEYEPLYPFLKDNLPEGEKEKLGNAFKVYAADFVTTEDGTGIVHTAVMYGADDFALGTKVGLPKYHLVKEDGTFKDGTGFLSGRYVKEKNEAGKPTLDVDIIDDLKKRNLFFAQENYKHTYPHCWRCKTPLIYFARDSWYIGMSRLRDKLVSENEKINWEPSYIKEGRFGDWLREVKDWAISRERYWGTPLPVWMSEDGSERLVVDSIETLKKHTKKSGNKYFVMRHGGTECNQKNLVSFKDEKRDHLTEDGKVGVLKSAKDLSSKNIDIIVYSPFTRTKETALLVAEELGISSEKIIVEDRLHEVDPGDFDGGPWDKYHGYVYDIGEGWFERRIPNGESLKDVHVRVGAALYDLESKYKDKNILLVTHGGPAWLLFVNAGMYMPDRSTYYKPDDSMFVKDFKRFDNAEVRELPFVPLPHNEDYELDLHKPFIDEVELVSLSGKNLKRVKEVMDVWFDSGAMPFAEDHFPFEGKVSYPADFISEAIDQTRGWFYTLHAVGNLMGRGLAYKNVICLGHLMDKNGKKMSKSLGNVIDPWEQMDKFGVDAIRFWMYSVNQPGESKNYDEKTVDEINKKVFNLVSNVYTFYELYRDKTLEMVGEPESSHALDKWLILRFENLVSEVTASLDSYKLLEPVRAIREFIDDLSTWYLQLSRDRFRDGDAGAKTTLYYVLKNLAKVLAPFAPFYAEDLYQKLRKNSDRESVHLEDWPKAEPSKRRFFEGLGFPRLLMMQASARPSKNRLLLEQMDKTRKIVSLALDARMKANVKVRQPLAKLYVKTFLSVPEELLDLVKERVNVKSVVFDDAIASDAELDTNISDELREEGIVREIIRLIQDKRKSFLLNANDNVALYLGTDDAKLKETLENISNQNLIKKAVNAADITIGNRTIDFAPLDGFRISIDVVKK